MSGPLAIRKGLGFIYLLSGLFHLAVMVFATLYSLGRIHFIVTGRLWSEMYYAHFLFMVLAGAGYLTLSSRRGGVFYPETLVDFLVGIGAFIVMIGIAGLLLVRGLVSPWFSLTPGAFLVYYGTGLLRGSRLGVPLEKPLPP